MCIESVSQTLNSVEITSGKSVQLKLRRTDNLAILSICDENLRPHLNLNVLTQNHPPG